MTTATKTQSYRCISIGDAPIDSIEVVSNFRKTFQPARLKELTDSIRQVGVLEPVLVRESERVGMYILIAGERRLRAAKAAGLTEIPYRSLDVTEEQAAEIQALENLHRENLGPIEEARAFQTLIAQGKYDVDALAKRMDKSPTYVYRAVKLLELPTAAMEAIEAGFITPAHGHQILRAPEGKTRDELVKFATTLTYNDSYPTVRQMEEQLDGKNLADATFPTKTEYAGVQACTKCPYNTGNQGNLFDGAEKGGCTNAPCFNTKTETAWNDKVDTLVRVHAPTPVIVVKGYMYEGGIVQGYQAKAQLTEKTKIGKNDAILINKDGTWLGKKVAEQPKPAAAPRLSPEEQALQELTSKLTEEATARAIFAKVKQVPVKAWAGTAEHIVNEMYGSQRFVYQAIGGETTKHFAALPVPQLHVLLYLASEVDNIGIEKLAKQVGVDVKKIEKEAKATAAIQVKAKK